MLRMAQADTPEAARAGGHQDCPGDARGRAALRAGRAGERALRPLQRRRRGHRQRAAETRLKINPRRIKVDIQSVQKHHEHIPYARRRACIPQTPERELRGLLFWYINEKASSNDRRWLSPRSCQKSKNPL